MATQNQSAYSGSNTHFDLHINGIGYLNRAREVEVKSGGRRAQPFLAVDITALRGDANDVQYTRFDCRVSGREAQEVIRDLMSAIRADQKVLVGFRLGDLYPETFTYQQGPKAGQTGVSLKARLLFIAWAKVDGQLVYKAPDKTPAAEDQGPHDAAPAGEFQPAVAAAA
jgi:hypothetical protein